MRVFDKASFKFLRVRRRGYVVSGVLIAAGLVSIILRGGLNAGVEFTGGTLLEVQFQAPTNIAEIRDALTSAQITGAQIQQLGGIGEASQDYLLRVPTSVADAGDDEVGSEVEAALGSGFGLNFEIVRGDAMTAKVGSEFQRKAVIAVLLSFLLTLIYLAFRFEWLFGVSAVVATIHDMMITFGFISLLDFELSLATVAAILTIIGYSLNDTIVVFDRVRENLKKRRKESYEETLNRSLNETLPRTVLTSGTTLVALAALALIGGTVIRPFATVLIMGVVVGTYSSILVASPVLLELHNWARRRAASAAHAAG
jgi:preprotein translocase subunit SecF